MLTAPFTPMLFMGEEWGADTPWQFFTDHTDPFFAEAVSTGRRSEFAGHGWGFAEVPDPQDKETFLRSKLDWSQPGREPYRSLLDWYRALLALRRARPELTDPASTRCASTTTRTPAGCSCTAAGCGSPPTWAAPPLISRLLPARPSRSRRLAGSSWAVTRDLCRTRRDHAPCGIHRDHGNKNTRLK